MKPFAKSYHVVASLVAPHFMSPSFTAQSLSPIQIAKAYQLQRAVKVISPIKIGIGSMGGQLKDSDITAAFAKWGLPAPKVTRIGATQSDDPGGANVENMLDVEVVGSIWGYCTGTPAEIVFCSVPNTDTGIADGTDQLVAAGCKVISWSWGAAKTSWSASSLSVTSQAFSDATAKGVIICAASGDNSANDGTNRPTPDYPCCDPNVWAEGGTQLVLDANGAIAQESAWGDGQAGDAGGGGGYDTDQSTPNYQVGILPAGATGRGVPDGSGNADPASAWQIMSDGTWMEVGGTSASSPCRAAYFAVCLASGIALPLRPVHRILYTHPEAFHDIVLGSDGNPAAKGWDGATGLGSTDGPNFYAVFNSTVAPSPPPPPLPVPPPSPPPVPPPQPPVPPPVAGPTLSQVLTAIDGVFASLKAQLPGRYRRLLGPYIDMLNQAVDMAVTAVFTANP
jgi:kumamolisin